MATHLVRNVFIGPKATHKLKLVAVGTYQTTKRIMLQYSQIQRFVSLQYVARLTARSVSTASRDSIFHTFHV